MQEDTSNEAKFVRQSESIQLQEGLLNSIDFDECTSASNGKHVCAALDEAFQQLEALPTSNKTFDLILHKNYERVKNQQKYNPSINFPLWLYVCLKLVK